MYYVITKGCYSDYRIIGVTMNKKVAYDYVEIRNRGNVWKGDAYAVEEYEDIDGKIEVGKVLYYVMKMLEGEKKGKYLVYESEIDEVEGKQEVGVVWLHGKRGRIVEHSYLSMYIWAENKDKAIEDAKEKFEMFENGNENKDEIKE